MHTQESVAKFCADWDKAMEGNHAEEIGQYMSDDWVCLSSSGLTSKATFLAHIGSGDLQHSRMDSDEMYIKVYGDNAVVVSKGTSAGTYKGQAFSLYEWSTSVLVFAKEAWSCVHTMLTPVAEGSPGAG